MLDRRPAPKSSIYIFFPFCFATLVNERFVFSRVILVIPAPVSPVSHVVLRLIYSHFHVNHLSFNMICLLCFAIKQ